MTSVAIAAATSLIMIAPVGIVQMSGDLAGLAMFGGGIVVSLLIVMAAVQLSQPMVKTVVMAGVRRV